MALLKTNIVDKKALRSVQINTLKILRDAVAHSKGPFGTTTQIIPPNVTKDAASGYQMAYTKYTKDGHEIIEASQLSLPIENSIQKEITEMTRHIVKEVGDGTTSTVELAYLIFKGLCDIEKELNVPPYQVIKVFKEIAADVKSIIEKNKKDLTIDDVFKIAMICTNSDETISRIISDIYKENGIDVFVDVAAGTSDETYIKTYDGLTLETGFADPCFINTVSKSGKSEEEGKAIIRNPKIYAFVDPIDTIEMTNMFTTIVYNNILTPYNMYQKSGNAEALKNIQPTVIMSPRISIDQSKFMTDITEFMYQFPAEQGIKPPLLIITNFEGENKAICSDIWRLCGCKLIKKYIDPEIQKKDQEAGDAPTVENICDFCGSADEVVSDIFKSTFINPSLMYDTDNDGNREYSQIYKTQISFLESTLVTVEAEGDANEIGNLKRRIHSLKANMVDLIVGGITITDRDSVRALAEDAVKNIRSSAKYGYGRAANFEGYMAIRSLYSQEQCNVENGLKMKVLEVLGEAYKEIIIDLYMSSGLSNDEAVELLNTSIEKECPFNLVTKKFDGSVLSTIKSDVIILDTLSKIISIMFTTNQTLVQQPALNFYDGGNC